MNHTDERPMDTVAIVPRIGCTQPDSLPSSLRQHASFCCWRRETHNNRTTKVPYNPSRPNKYARSNDPATFGTFEQAQRCAEQNRMDGIGVGLFDGLCAIDIDHCIANGQISEAAQDILDTMHSYAETSPGGSGLHIYFRATIDFDREKWYINNHDAGIEVYISGHTKKYMTVTGNALNDLPVEDRSAEIVTVLNKYMRRETKHVQPSDSGSLLSDEQVLKKAMAAANGQKFTALWNGELLNYRSHSEADAALCGMLAFWCGRDSEQIDRLFRRSGLMREKWNEKHGADTYGNTLIRKVCAECTEVYKPRPEILSDIDMDRLRRLAPECNSRYAYGDIGKGYLFADFFEDRARYVPERKGWYIYNGVIWEDDVGSLQAMELCKALALALLKHAAEIENEDVRKSFLKVCEAWQSRRVREIILRDAASVNKISKKAFDADPMLLNCLNGTLDLSDRPHIHFREHRPADMLTKVCGAAYDPDARCLRWEQFISEIMSGKRGKAAFLQKALGYTLTGDTSYEAMFILYGATSRNGKGTTCETILKLMGAYGIATRPETLGVKQSNPSGPSEDIARLAGARYVNLSEPDKNLKLNAALVKSMVGNDTLNARFLNENSFDFKPQFKLFINTNHLPQITDMTLFSSERIKVIPFEKHFEDDAQDKTLKNSFVQPDALSGILNWCLMGWQRLCQEGLSEPEEILNATEEYAHESDKFALFMEEKMVPASGAEVRTSEAYQVFRDWCEENGYGVENTRNFKAMMEKRTQVCRKRPNFGGNPTTMIIGYRIAR